MIDFTLTDEQAQLRVGARDFAQNILAAAPAIYNQHPSQKTRFQSTRPIYRKAVEAGFIKGQIPAALGGSAGSLINAAILVEELYSVEPSASLTILGTIGGSPEQHERLLKPFLSGNGEPLASLVHSEPGGTANWLEKGAPGLQTTAKKEGEDWIINGDKVQCPRHLLAEQNCAFISADTMHSSGQLIVAAGMARVLTYNASSAGSLQKPGHRIRQSTLLL
jgi:alkylation response protein AidB-like acyl-CoA dehydrogenase